ncbi:hypothetical protein COU75_02380 [Candidatus Peregrinibacteria bacterium CG10_big_fil_rev_8_21_14_0_10_42_8]|nr:MAG: hypothetical protein COU75_02380 [Candidatus Peregrinibacteria bacterium CG10_big_fil_rev_8_21_14_0_10_42_8]
MNTHIPTEEPILEWTAPQHLHHERTRLWYIIATLCIVGFLTYSVYTAAWTFTLVLVIMTGLYLYVHEEEPTEKHMRIWKKGYALEENFVAWAACDGYWILKGKGYYELHIEKKNGYETKIQIGENDPYKIHDTITLLTPELHNRKERILDTIIRICKL